MKYEAIYRRRSLNPFGACTEPVDDKITLELDVPDVKDADKCSIVTARAKEKMPDGYELVGIIQM